MKILQLRFLNLNSLLGEWQIDLTDPAFDNDGIFAITGPTGAGKSTILDAICLALYGRTPRLSKITKGSNEIMSRHSGECFAEITFATPSGQFRCHWSQHRARKKASGDLQAPKHEIADALSGQIIEAKIRNVAQRIESITGMDFERFTLSMLLAQGSFAAFLQAAPDQRAPILEQITGSAIYSQISTRVHQLRGSENNTLNTLTAELAGMALLSTEDEAELNTKLAQQKQQAGVLNNQGEQYNQAITWLETIGGLQGELQVLEQQQQALHTRHTAFQDKAVKLQAAERALQLAPHYASLCSLRQAQRAEQINKQQYHAKLPAKKLALSQAQNKLQESKYSLTESRKAQSLALPNIRRAQALDLKSQEQQAPLTNAATALKELKQGLDHLQEQQQTSRTDLAGSEAELGKLLARIANSRADETLLDRLSGLQNRFAALRVLTLSCREKMAEHDCAKAERRNTLATWQQQSSQLVEQERDLQQLIDRLSLLESERLQTLDGQELSHWRKSQAELVENQRLLESLGLQHTALAQSQGLGTKLDTQHQELCTNIAANKQKLLVHTEKQTGLGRELTLLETQVSLLNKIQSFEQARQQLEDGEPCPLCGANDHPYAAGNVPQAHGSTTRLGEVRAELSTVNQELLTYQLRAAENNKELEQISQQQETIAQQVNHQQGQLQQSRQQLSNSGFTLAESDEFAASLPQFEQDNRELLAGTNQRLHSIDQQDQALATLRDSLERAKKTANQLAQQHLTAGHRKDAAEQTCARLYKEQAQLTGQLENEQREILATLAPYGITTLAEDGFAATEATLITRREQWRTKQLEKAGLDQGIGKLTLRIQHQSQQLSEKSGDLEKQRISHNALLNKLQALKLERTTLFADKDPLFEESLLAEAVASSEKQVDKANQYLHTSSEEATTLKSQIEAIENSLQNRSHQLRLAEEGFKQDLSECSFISESDYQAASISAELRGTLTREAEQLSAEKSGLNARYQDRDERLKTERNKHISERTIGAIKQDFEQTVEQLKQVQQELGACQQQLDDNQQLRARQQERSSVIDAQRIECERWDNLHLLIGSADGKKYRNFAQGLTFELLVGHANRQLQKMSDRYLLIRDKGQPLELNVVDNYQAGEIRSTKNLSGGESFIVSLALALGLSQMASKNVRVDSLFLDEGFGTLDEEALDTALEALSSLQQSGKLIGVISHVASLKERIGTQLQVSPETGGRSVIRGPGCRRLN
ncbi:MAG: AAA family ATPase [Porticoccaceae bacterium]|nr:AAA family ATPase [Porticoccaceae bacterium]